MYVWLKINCLLFCLIEFLLHSCGFLSSVLCGLFQIKKINKNEKFKKKYQKNIQEREEKQIGKIERKEKTDENQKKKINEKKREKIVKNERR